MRRMRAVGGAKKAVLGFVLGMALVGCDKPEPQTVTFEVEGMVCESCSEAITAEVEKIEGVSSVLVDHEAGTAVVTFTPGEGELDRDPGEAVQAIESKIDGLGYEATPPQS